VADRRASQAITPRRATLRRAAALLLGLSSACRATPPTAFETAVASRVKRHLTVGGASDRNPLSPTEENVRAGQRAFAGYCWACHGLDGQNTGVPFASAMSPPVPPLSSAEVQAYTDGQLKWVIENGLFPSGMPAARGLLSDEEMWRVVVFVRHLPKAGSLGEPAPYGGGAPAAP